MRSPSRRLHVVIGASLSSVVALTALWLGGGLASADRPPEVRPGKEVDQHLFHTRLMGAHVTTTPERKLLVINAWVTNPTRQTVGTHSGVSDDVFSHGMFLRWKPEYGPRPTLVDAQGIAGDTLFRGLQPRRPTYVAVQYELAAGARVPDRLTVALADYEHTAAGVLDPRDYWVWRARRYETRFETNPLTHRSGRVTHIIPVLIADVTLPVRR